MATDDLIEWLQAEMAGVTLTDEHLDRIIGEMRAQVTSEEAEIVRHVLRQWIERVTLWQDAFKVEFREVELPAVVQVYSVVPPRGFAVKTYNFPKLPLAFCNFW